MSKKVSTPKQRPVLESAVFELADAVALQAIANGRADELQQKRALDWIIYKACDFHGISYRDNERDTSFAEGKRFIAQQINALLTHNTRII